MKKEQKTLLLLIVSFIILLNTILVIHTISMEKLAKRITQNENIASALDASLASTTDSLASVTDTLSSATDALASMSDAIEQSSATDAELKNQIEDLQKQIDELTSKKEEPTTETKKEEPTTTTTKTEKNTTTAKTDTTETPTTETTQPEEDYTEYHHDGNVWGITLTDSDINYLYRMAETETHGADMMSKTHVISVALNRCIKYGQSPTTVITAPNQFGYWQTGITDSTKQALDYVLQNGDTARGALFFHSGGYSATFCGRPCIFGDDVGHYFY